MLVPARCATHTESVCQCVFSVDLCRLFMTAATCSLSSLHPELLLLLTVRLLVCSAVCCAGTSDHLWLCLHAKYAELQGHLKQPAERRGCREFFFYYGAFPKLWIRDTHLRGYGLTILQIQQSVAFTNFTNGFVWYCKQPVPSTRWQKSLCTVKKNPCLKNCLVHPVAVGMPIPHGFVMVFIAVVGACC